VFVAFVATLFIKALPLRNTASGAEDAGQEVLVSSTRARPKGGDSTIEHLGDDSVRSFW
jgi:hypothetical protein